MRVHALDIGGANIKAASATLDEKVAMHDLRTMSVPFALWRAPQELLSQLRLVQSMLGHFDAMAITMTGELCDCFASRREGVDFILDAIAHMAGDIPVRVWSATQGYISLAVARENWLAVASANWHAQATSLAHQFPQGTSLLLDVGSTTTDIVKLKGGHARPIGLTDAQRLRTSELIYTGATRTSLMAVMNQWGEGSSVHRIMAEHFATMADVYTLLGDLPEDESDCETADGNPMTREHAATRILRMVGSDLSMDSVETAMIWADRFASAQLQQIAQGLKLFCGGEQPQRVLISGSGAFIGLRAAQLALPACDVLQWASALSPQASDAACAVALLDLWHRHVAWERGGE